MTDRQKRNKEVIEYLQNYINSYPEQSCYLDYIDQTIIDDMLYGLGVALYGDECKFANGYDKFKQILMNHLTRNMIIVKK